MFGKTNPFRFVRSITSNLLRGLAGPAWGIDREAKTVETSRYSYATNLDGQRFWFSKPSVFSDCNSGVTLEVNGYAGDSTMRVRVKDYGRIVWDGFMLAEEAKAWAAVLSTAAVRGRSRTGRRMDHTCWADQAAVSDTAAAKVKADAGLFDLV
jgi:hypothetical protein